MGVVPVVTAFQVTRLAAVLVLTEPELALVLVGMSGENSLGEKGLVT